MSGSDAWARCRKDKPTGIHVIISACRKNAFTIVELTSVLVIVLILLGLLLPLLVKAREAARRTRCAANLSTLGAAFQNYASSNNGYVPRAYRQDLPSHPPWMSLLGVYLGLRRPFSWADLARVESLHCPSHPTDGPTTHFVVNAFDHSVPGQWFAKGLTRLSSVRRTSDLPWLLETPPLLGRMTYFPFDDIFADQSLEISQPAHLYGGGHARLGDRNHGLGVSNVLFADGHVTVRDNRSLKSEDFNDSR